MEDTAKKSTGVGDIFEDYATRPVPEGKRISWLSQGMVWAGGDFCMAMFSIGGILASSMDFGAFITAVLLGAAVITLIGSLTGFIGAKTHLPAAFNSRFALGVGGGRIFGLILAVSLFGWFGYQCHYFADSAIASLKMLGFAGSSHTAWAVMGGLLMMITAVVGFRGITLIAELGVPLCFLLILISVGNTAVQVDFSALRTALVQTGGGMGVPGGVVIVVGSFITGSCMISDISRFSRKPKDASRSCIMGFMVTVPVLLFLGGFFYYAYGTADLCEVFAVHCGMGMFIPFVLVVSTWTTNDSNLYSSVLGISNALDDQIRLPRWLLTLVVGIISTLLGAFGIMDTFVSFLNLLGVLIPPVAAVIIADYYFYNRNSGLYDYSNVDKLERFRGNTCFSAVVGILTGLLCNYTDIAFLAAVRSVLPASIVAMLAGVAALVIYNTVTRSGTVTV